MQVTERRTRAVQFVDWEVQATLDGSKMQFRRAMKPQPSMEWAPEYYGEIHGYNGAGELDPGIVKGWGPCSGDGEEGYWCPYGKPGDLLWVKENYWIAEIPARGSGNAFLVYENEVRDGCLLPVTDRPWQTKPQRWGHHASIHMPRWASRITLEVTDVRVEQVQSIDHADAIAEGMTNAYGHKGSVYYRTETAAFHVLWNTLNAKRGYSWASNPWVWVVEFKHPLKSVDK